jgi:hypothetical protein
MHCLVLTAKELDMRAKALLAAGSVLTMLASTAGAAHGASGHRDQDSKHGGVAITTTKAKKLAKAGVLTTRDMPGFEVAPQPSDPHDAADELAVHRCLGIEVPTFAARNSGRAFTAGPLEVDSSADVIATVSGAKAHMRALTSTKAPGCIKKEIVRVLKRQGAAINSVTVTPIAVKATGADAVFAYRYTAKITVQRQQFKLVGHELDLRVGQTEITISPGVYNAPGPSLKTTITLANKLAKRVRAI